MTVISKENSNIIINNIEDPINNTNSEISPIESFIFGFCSMTVFIILVDTTKIIFKKYFSDFFLKREKKKLERHKKFDDDDNSSNPEDVSYEDLAEATEDSEIYNYKYRTSEFKLMLISTFLFLVFLYFILIKYSSKIPFIKKFKFKEYLIHREIKNVRKNILSTIAIQIINLILYTGLIIQLVYKIEHLSKKNFFNFFMENIYAPILEETIYRGIIFNSFRMGNLSSVTSAVISSLMFGISHLRHIWDNGFTKNAMNRIYFQIIYTTLFGFYTCYAYTKGGSLLSSIILHGVCNTLQMPRFGYLHYHSVSNDFKNVISGCYIGGILVFILSIYYYH